MKKRIIFGVCGLFAPIFVIGGNASFSVQQHPAKISRVPLLTSESYTAPHKKTLKQVRNYQHSISTTPIFLQPNLNVWGILAGIGFTSFNNMMQSDGTTILGRLALTRQIMRYDHVDWGLELGAQLGNQSRGNFTDAQLEPIGGVPVQITIKPGLDFLATAKKQLHKAYPISFLFKVGFIYRQMFTDRDTISELKRINPEIQIGLTKEIAKQTALEVTYQGIYSHNMALTTTGSDGGGTGSISNVPSQNGLLFTIHFLV